MTETVKIVSPVDGRIYAERPVASAAEIETARHSGSAARAADNAALTSASLAIGRSA